MKKMTLVAVLLVLSFFSFGMRSQQCQYLSDEKSAHESLAAYYLDAADAALAIGDLEGFAQAVYFANQELEIITVYGDALEANGCD